MTTSKGTTDNGFDIAALRYHPTRMRWLYECTHYGDFASATGERGRQIEGGNLLGTAAYLDIDGDVSDDLEALEGHYAKWLSSHGRTIIDLSNQFGHIRPLEEGDERFQVEASICEDATYFHFGRPVSGFDGFYAEYDADGRSLSFALVGGGNCSDPDAPPAELAVSFGPVFYGYLDTGPDIIGQVVRGSMSGDEEMPAAKLEAVRAGIMHMLAVLRHVHVMQDGLRGCWPGDAPALLSRRADISLTSGAERGVVPDGGVAEDMLWNRGWTKVEIMPVPGAADLVPDIDIDRLSNPKERTQEIARFARHVVETERRLGAEGHTESTTQNLTVAIEQAFLIGGRTRHTESPFVDLITSEHTGNAAWMLGVAAYGKTPGAPVMDAHYRRAVNGRWRLWLHDDEMMVGAIAQAAVDEMERTGLVRISEGRARPTPRLERHHRFFIPYTRSEDYGALTWMAAA